MTVALATAWRPRGELSRLVQLLPVLRKAYTRMVVSLPPDAEDGLLSELSCLSDVEVCITPQWSWGRYLALQRAFETGADHIHYVDFDRLLRWVETYFEEWRAGVGALQHCDCLVFGRSPAAYATHPQALVQTEALSNAVTSYLVGQVREMDALPEPRIHAGEALLMDVSAGSKGFSRRAAAFLVAQARHGPALGADAEWLVLLKRAGFHIDYRLVDGLDWESADRYQETAADAVAQRKAAEAYDADPSSWEHRLAVAREVIESGLEAAQRPLPDCRND